MRVSGKGGGGGEPGQLSLHAAEGFIAPQTLSGASEVLGREAGGLGDLGEHHRADLLVIMEGEDEVWPPRLGENDVRAGLALDLPTDPQEGREDAPCFGGWKLHERMLKRFAPATQGVK